MDREECLIKRMDETQLSLSPLHPTHYTRFHTCFFVIPSFYNTYFIITISGIARSVAPLHLVESAVDRGDQRVLHVAICSQRRIGCAVLSQATKSEFT